MTPSGEPVQYAKGLDVSQWQGNRFPFGSAAGDGYAFAYIRASVRTMFDPRFQLHRHKARQAGLLTGAYHYLYPFPDAEEQAHTFLQVLDDCHDDELPPALDVEEIHLQEAQIRLFVDTIHHHTGSHPIIYTSRHKWHQIAGTEALWAASCRLWVADWDPERDQPRIPEPWTDWTLWQFTSRGSIPNHYGRVDLNYYNGTTAHLREYYPELRK